MARTLFPGAAALGARIGDATEKPDWMEVVGVVADVRSIDVAQAPSSFQLYKPAAQDPRHDFMVAARTAGVAGGSVSASIGAAVADLDPDLTVRALMPVTARMQEVTSQMALMQQLLVAFAVLGLLLASLGIYGAMTRMVAHRTNEIGLRMALGAQVSHVVGLVFRLGRPHRRDRRRRRPPRRVRALAPAGVGPAHDGDRRQRWSAPPERPC